MSMLMHIIFVRPPLGEPHDYHTNVVSSICMLHNKQVVTQVKRDC